MVMDLLDPRAAQTGLDAEKRQAIVDEVIDAVNREFPGSTLRAPTESERVQVSLRVRSLVANAFRTHNLPPSEGEQALLAEEIARRVMGLGFLDLLLPPARTDLSEITIYSSGLIQVMKKGRAWSSRKPLVDECPQNLSGRFGS